jgi:hypothetical protein
MFAGWVNRHQLDVIEYLHEENRVLKERMSGRRLRFTDAERRRLALKAQALARKVLNELQTLVTPDMLLRWFLPSRQHPTSRSPYSSGTSRCRCCPPNRARPAQKSFFGNVSEPGGGGFEVIATATHPQSQHR